MEREVDRGLHEREIGPGAELAQPVVGHRLGRAELVDRSGQRGTPVQARRDPRRPGRTGRLLRERREIALDGLDVPFVWR